MGVKNLQKKDFSVSNAIAGVLSIPSHSDFLSLEILDVL